VSLVAVARLTNGRPCSRFRTRPAATLAPCGQTSFIGPAIRRGAAASTRASAAHVQNRDKPTRRMSSAAPGSSSPVWSHRRHRCSIGGASPGQGCGQWTVLLLSRATHRPLTNRIRAHRDSLFRVSPMPVNKKQRFCRGSDEKSSCAMQCDASMSQKPPRHHCRGGLLQSPRTAQTRLSIGTNGTFSGPV
jgi:hypothetical protein